MSISIYNTLTSQKEPFQPLVPQQVNMYCCGVTVYDLCHVGHGRSYVVWDTVRRYLEWRGYSVKYIQNFTDIDDKILNRAREQNSSMEAVSGKYIAAYLADLARLNVQPANSYPRATEHIKQIIALIQDLEAKELAYAAAGDVYYRVAKFPGYGKLSGRKLADMLAGASGRVEAAEQQKENPGDFALWKSAKEGEPFWDSPWGKGRPGWHIECSAMINAAFDGEIDIHCGGSDLIFPHHENEIAQSEGAHDHPLAKYWMHNGMVVVDGVKMSKSLGNFTTLRDLLDRSPNPIDPMVIRLFILTAQYRKPLDFTKTALASNAASWQTLKTGLLFGAQFGEKLGWDLNAEIPVAPAVPLATPNPLVDLLPIASLTPQVVAPFVTLPDNIRKFSQEYRGLIVLAVILFFTQFPIKFLASFVANFNTVPLLPDFFKAVGLAVFVRTILFKAPREKFFATLRGLLAATFKDRSAPEAAAQTTTITADAQSTSFQKFCMAVDEDFNFAGGLAVLFELAKSLGKQANILNHGSELTVESGVLFQQWQELSVLANVLGLEVRAAESVGAAAPIEQSPDQSDAEINALVAQRNQARQHKDFGEADRIRKELEAKGVELIDKQGTTTWRYH